MTFDDQRLLSTLETDLAGESVRPALLASDPDLLQTATTDYRGWYRGEAMAVARPRSVAEVQSLVRACSRHRIAVVPQGGNSSLCGGAVPARGIGPAIVLNLNGLDRIRSVNPVEWSMVAEAGCTLSAVQQAAGDAGRRFGLDIGARGSARIGGLVATNAGGSAVLRYGSCRDLVSGLEVVLPNGELWSGLRTLRKDNSGFDLKQLFIGTEGTLGIVTAAALRLHPADRHSVSALLALTSLAAANAVADLFIDRSAGRLTSIELMPDLGIRLATQHVTRTKPPLPLDAGWYVLVRIEGAEPVEDTMEELAALALEAGLCTDAVVSRSTMQENTLWAIRDGFSEAHRHLGASHRFDLSVPLGAVPGLYTELCEVIARIEPNFVPFGFGHLGDGNLHFSACQPPDEDGARFAAIGHAVAEVVNAVVWRLGGSISAEHGIGQLHRAELAGQKTGLELSLMGGLKSLLDPAGLMNPGQLLP